LIGSGATRRRAWRSAPALRYSAAVDSPSASRWRSRSWRPDVRGSPRNPGLGDPLGRERAPSWRIGKGLAPGSPARSDGGFGQSQIDVALACHRPRYTAAPTQDRAGGPVPADRQVILMHLHSNRGAPRWRPSGFGPSRMMKSTCR